MALFPTYGNRFNVVVESANGTIVTDIKGKEYLDFGSGIGVNNLGHRNEKVQTAVEEQLNKYWHVSNLYHQPIQEEVATKLTENRPSDLVFFCNSGAEANEAAIKLARKATKKTKIITFEKSFHGRTFATMSATGQEKVQTGFGPLLETFQYVPFNDVDAMKEAIDDDTAAVMLEVIQGEGGVINGNESFLKTVEHVCKENNVLLIIDEIQTGMGRTGKRFAYEHIGLSPDIITVAKALGNGLPVGAMIAKKELKDAFGPGSHGSTFGGNPLAMSAAKAVLNIIFEPNFLKTTEEKGTYLQTKLTENILSHPFVTEIRGKGLMIGIVCEGEVTPIVTELIEQGLLVLSAGANTIRLLPPLTVNKQEMDKAVAQITNVLKNMK